MPLILSPVSDTTTPIELEGLTPDRCASLSTSEIQNFTCFEGNRKRRLADLFHISGTASDLQLVLQGDLSRVHWIGAGMRSGSVRIEGDAGRHLGSSMSGGVIEVTGNTAGWAGAEMRKGLIRIRGNAGQFAGGALPGSIRGMTGGTLLIHGNCGDEAGLAMRRGLIAIAGSAGEFAGRNMIAGTLLTGGRCGRRAGAGMRRGTLVLTAGSDCPLLPGFRHSATLQLTTIRLLQKRLLSLDFPVDPAQLNAPLSVYRGDLAAKGLGEIILPAESVP
ncbi:MAG: formylmethanofuran dehydrogenase subunit C [Planctomycetaceae bacterium]